MTLSGWDIPVFKFDPNIQIGKQRFTYVTEDDLLNTQERPDEDDHVWLLETESGLNGPGTIVEVVKNTHFDGTVLEWSAYVKVDWKNLTLAEECEREDS